MKKINIIKDVYNERGRKILILNGTLNHMLNTINIML